MDRWRARSRRFEPIVARLTNGVMFKFPIANVDDINVLRPDFDVAGFYNAKSAVAAFRRLTDSARSGSIAEGYNYDAMVRGFRARCDRSDREQPGRRLSISTFAPYSILHFVAMRDASPATLKITHDFAAYAFPRLLQFPNVRLHDFRDVKEVNHDLGNYGDVIHHSPAIDLKILSWLAERKYVVDPCSTAGIAGTAEGAGRGVSGGALERRRPASDRAQSEVVAAAHVSIPSIVALEIAVSLRFATTVLRLS